MLMLLSGMQAQFYSYKQHVNHANEAFATKNYLEAMTHYEKALELNDNLDAVSTLNYADAAFNTYALKVAETQYKNYLLLNSDDEQHLAQYKLAKLKHLQGQYAEAVTDYEIYLSEYEKHLFG